MSTSKSRTYHHGDLREALIGAGLAMLEEGVAPAAFSLREAARRSDVSAMAPYRHFADKEALLAAVAAVGFARLAERLREADAAPSQGEALVQQGVAYVAFACAYPALFRLMFGSALAARHGDLAVASDDSYAVMSRRVTSIVADKGDADDWSLRCWATVHGLAALAVDGQLQHCPGTPTTITDRVLRLVGNLPGL